MWGRQKKKQEGEKGKGKGKGRKVSIHDLKEKEGNTGGAHIAERRNQDSRQLQGIAIWVALEGTGGGFEKRTCTWKGILQER